MALPRFGALLCILRLSPSAAVVQLLSQDRGRDHISDGPASTAPPHWQAARSPSSATMGSLTLRAALDLPQSSAEASLLPAPEAATVPGLQDEQQSTRNLELRVNSEIGRGGARQKLRTYVPLLKYYYTYYYKLKLNLAACNSQQAAIPLGIILDIVDIKQVR
ncbi:hypothetical protein C8R44DRAFT_739450 [Mycena epipterygia]|nr:hypothetical protein C8R44DRAFT_739450 [Mycena epipterygia]